MLKTPVIASQITNLTDARYFAARGVEYLSFNLDAGTESAISPQQLNAIKEWVEGPKIIGAFGLQEVGEIKTAINYIELEAVQLSMFSKTETFKSGLAVPIFFEIVAESDSLSGIFELIEGQAINVDYFILDLSKSRIAFESIDKEQQSQLKEICTQHKVFLNLFDQAETINHVLKKVQPYGLVLSGGAEEKVGLKSYDELDDILDVLELEE